MPLTYDTDSRGRGGVYKPVAPGMKRPRAAIPPAPFVAQPRPDGLHIVERATGQSFGIASTPAIAGEQIAALGRMAR